MPIPDFQTFMFPLLEAIADGREHRMRDVTTRLADRFGLSEEEREHALPSGNKVVVNRVAWAKAHLKSAGLLDNSVRGMVRLTDKGRRVLDSRPEKLDVAFLRRFARQSSPTQ